MSTPGAVLDTLHRRGAPGLALAAKLTGGGEVEIAAHGATVRLSDGRELIDFGSYGVSLLGHRHPAIVAAVAAQLERMPATTRVLANPVTAACMDELATHLGQPLGRVWLGSDGADAVELAVKLARRATGRPRVLAVKGSFHGKTLGALALTWNPALREGAGQLAPVTHLDDADPLAVERETAAGDVAAIVFEPVQGEGGARKLNQGVLRRWTQDAHRAGAFAICDEVQTGMRRCGPLSVAKDAGIEIDAVLLGKALGGGVMPLSAVVGTRELFDPLLRDPTWHTTTFGGHPLACAAGSAALRLVDELAPAAADLAVRLQDGLASLARAHSEVVKELHGIGLLRGIELRSPGAAGSVVIELAQAGVLVSPCLSAPSTVRLLPPMVTTCEQLGRALEALDIALATAGEYVGEGLLGVT